MGGVSSEVPSTGEASSRGVFCWGGGDFIGEVEARKWKREGITNIL